MGLSQKEIRPEIHNWIQRGGVRNGILGKENNERKVQTWE